MGEADRNVLRYARNNGGVVTRSEAIALGMTTTTIDRRLASGHLVRAGSGIYVLPGVLDAENTLLRSAVAALGAVVSHESAARLHGLSGLDPRRITVSVPIRRSNRFLGVQVHQLTDLEEGHTTSKDGLAVTKPTRTLVDLAAVLPISLLATTTDQAVRMRLTTYREVSQTLEGLARRGKPGVTTLRRLLEPRLGGSFVSQSALETELLQVLEHGGLPVPHTQFRPEWLRQMNGRVDLAYVDEKVVIEGDSRRWHGDPIAFQADRRRDNLAQLAGWTILRFTWQDITERQEYVVATVGSALGLSTRRTAPIRGAEH